MVVTAERMLENIDLASDIEIVHARPDTGRHSLRRGRRKRAGAMQQHIDTVQMGRDIGGLVHAEIAIVQPQFLSQRRQRLGTTACQYGSQTFGYSLTGDQFTGIAIGAVDHERRLGHRESLECGHRPQISQ